MTQWLRIITAISFVAAPFAASAGDAERSWDFSVLLDGSPIGFHRFELVQEGDTQRLSSEARFDVRFLFINAFRYRHENREQWHGECLQSIESSTRQNGKEFSVNGARVGNRFVVEANGERDAVDECVMTFAYWNPGFLARSRLLDPQSGQYLPVEVEELGQQKFNVKGEQVLASAYRIRASKLELTVWYSDKDEWLGLESIAKGQGDSL